MSANLDAIVWYLRPIAEHLVNGLILSAVIFPGSLLAFRLLFREQRWSASTRHRASLFLFLSFSWHSDFDGLPANANQ
jgi:hypothetical protein